MAEKSEHQGLEKQLLQGGYGRVLGCGVWIVYGLLAA